MNKSDLTSMSVGAVIVAVVVFLILEPERVGLGSGEAPSAVSEEVQDEGAEKVAASQPSNKIAEENVSSAETAAATPASDEVGDEPATGMEAVVDTSPPEEISDEETASLETATPVVEESGASEAAAAPTLDIVRIEPDGTSLIAGQAEPNADVEIVVDGQVVGEAKAGEDGAFVAFIELPPAAPKDTDESALVVEDAVRIGASDGAPSPTESEASSTDETGGVDAEDVSRETETVEAGEGRSEMDETPDRILSSTSAGARAQSLVIRARPDETAPSVESSPAFVLKGGSDESAPLVVQPSEAGVRVVQPADRETADAVTLDVISYDEEGRVVLAGRARPVGAVRIYLNGALVGDAPVNDDGSWSGGAREEIDAGVYTLRLDQVDADGVVLSRAETPFLREAIDDGMIDPDSFTVQSGDNLWRIAESIYGEGVRYTLIFGANRSQIRDPDLIYPGQIFSIPDAKR